MPFASVTYTRWLTESLPNPQICACGCRWPYASSTLPSVLCVSVPAASSGTDDLRQQVGRVDQRLLGGLPHGGLDLAQKRFV